MSEIDDFVSSLGTGDDEPAAPTRRRVSKPFPSLNPPVTARPSVGSDESPETQDNDDDSGTTLNLDPIEQPPKKPKSPKRTAAPEVTSVISTISAEGEGEEEDSGTPMLPVELPKPDSVQTLGSLITRYQIGEDAGFKIHLYRLSPKYWKGSQIHGFVQEYDHALTEQMIAEEYQGGEYQLRFMGPDPKSGNGTGSRQYGTFKFSVGGDPNPLRIPRSMQAALEKAAVAPATTTAPASMASENPAIIKIAMDGLQKQAENERQDRLAQESKTNPLLEVVRKHAEDMIAAERERSSLREGHMEQALQASRKETKRIEEKLDTMSATPPPNLLDELSKFAALMPKANTDAEAAAIRASESITKSILDRHQTEIESIHKQHHLLLDSMRASHTSEVASMRDAGRREVEAEREASRMREQRHDDVLKTEREERRRDYDTSKRTSEERDVNWRDRLEQQEINLKTMWESRIETYRSNAESQAQWLRSENEQLQGRNRELTAKNDERGDFVKQMAQLTESKNAVKVAFDLVDSGSASGGGMAGGIGLDSPAAGGIDWGDVMREAGSLVPAVIGMFRGDQQAQQPPQQFPQQFPQQAQQQRQPQIGDVVQTPQGTMVVINTPQGLMLTPKDQFDAAQTPRGAPQQQQQPNRIFAAPQRQPSEGIPVPDMSVGLPKPRPWGEAVQPAMPPQSASPQVVNKVPSVRQDGNPMTQTETLVARQLAKLIHDSVSAGEEPSEFIAKLSAMPYAQPVSAELVKLSDEEVIRNIRTVQPNSAGASALGQRFIRESMAILRKTPR